MIANVDATTEETFAPASTVYDYNRLCITYKPNDDTMYDVAIIGGGILGLATANELQQRNPRMSVVVLEKESVWAAHQTGRNSGVIHSGIYYKPDSLKATMARRGNSSMSAFCRENGIPYDICGKLIVATKRSDLPQLEHIRKNGVQNGLAVTQISAEEVKDIEPHASCLAALRVPETGIVDYRMVCQILARHLEEGGARLKLNTSVQEIRSDQNSTELITSSETIHTRHFINCSGLQSDRLARMDHCERDARIVPFRGEYYELKPAKRYLVKNLIYPVPDPGFPFLGVHLTRMIDGSIHAGPNAVVSLSREGYGKLSVNFRDSADMLLFAGFWRLALKHLDKGMAEVWRSLSKRAFTKCLQQLVPEISDNDLEVSSAGIRAQALLPSGEMVDDFLIRRTPRGIHVCNAPSPAATASLEIAKYIASRFQEML